ncbi:MAG TPA: putative maltokinase [Gemmataceae bacterium]|nr:putative maltokinase [Gemmataceae bacterium]
MAETTRIPTLNLTGGWETLLEGTARETLEREVLPDYLRAQRWFGGKGRRIASLHFVDCGDFLARASRVFLMLLEVRFTDGKSDLYFLPLGVTTGDAASQIASAVPSLRIACVIGPGGEALLHDALADEGTCLTLLTAIGARAEFATRGGQVRAFPTAAFDELRGDAAQPLDVIRGPATSSNSLLFYGQRLLLKMFRRLEAGINPDFEIGRFLTESKRFERIPRVAGAIEYHRAGSDPITLAILQSFVVNQGDGWHHAVDELQHYYQRASEAAPIAPDYRHLLELADLPPPGAVRVIGGYLEAARTLGRRTAEMHRALAADANNADFAPEPFTPTDAHSTWSSIRAQADSALAALRDNLDLLPPDVRSSALQLVETGPALLHGSDPEALLHLDAAKIRCHGDYHLGQVLRVENDYVILDFEGEPVRSVPERRAKQSPLKDVAGMLRSYHYAAYAGLFAFTRQRPEDFGRFVPWAELWFRWVSAAFFHAYCAAAHGESFLPVEAVSLAALLDAFRLDKVFYELNYELNNRPDWVRIPLRGILTLLQKPLAA